MAKEKTNYDICEEMIYQLLAAWEQIHPEEELVVLVLPKQDLRERGKRLLHIVQMLMKEEHECQREGQDPPLQG